MSQIVNSLFGGAHFGTTNNAMALFIFLTWIIAAVAAIYLLRMIFRQHVGWQPKNIIVVGAILTLPLAVLLGRYATVNCASLATEYACVCHALAGERAKTVQLKSEFYTKANRTCPGHIDYEMRSKNSDG
jgi:hypothetical protein